MGAVNQDPSEPDPSTQMSVVSLGGRFLRVSPGLADALGLAPGELMELGPLAVTYPADRDRLTAMLGLMRAGSITKTKFRQRWLLAEGGAAEGLVSGSVIHGDDGAPSAFGFTVELAAPEGGRPEEEPIDGVSRRRAGHDGVTGLPDLALFLERLERALLTGTGSPSVTVLVLAVETDPHTARRPGRNRQADVLRAIAKRITAELEPNGFVTRLDDRSFGILQSGGDELTLAARARCLLKATSQPIVASGEEYTVHATLGIAVANQKDDARELLEAADRACRRARQLGADRFEFSELGDDRTESPVHALLDDIRHAPEREELRLRYQPVFDLADRSICGVEALLRWEHPSRTVLLPEMFLPAARRTGAIVPIGRWVLEQALRQLERWNEELAREEPLRLFLNVSAPELADPSFVDAVGTTLERGKISPEQLVLDVSDAALIDVHGPAWSSVVALRELGATIVLDRFGTTFSSLAQLERLPIDGVKLDRSCVAGVPDGGRDRAIVKALAAVAEARGLTLIACGIETECQIEAALALGCHAAQGFLFAEPRAARAVTKLLRWKGERAGRAAS